MTKPNDTKSIPLTWINDYLTWLDDMGSVFGTRNALAIRAMLKKWEMETDCGPDACKIGGQIVKEMTEKEAEHGDPVVL